MNMLKVPYYSQIKDTQNPKWKKDSCGVAALKMVLDYYQPTNLTIDELYQKGLDIDGYLEGVGWYHHVLAQLAKGFGYKAVTKSWNIPAESLEHLIGRGFSKEDIEIVVNLQLDEGIFTLKQEVLAGHPIIISVPKGFKEGGSGHLVVVIGFDDLGFIVNDPFDGEKIHIDFERFRQVWSGRFWTRRAILIRPK